MSLFEIFDILGCCFRVVINASHVLSIFVINWDRDGLYAGVVFNVEAFDLFEGELPVVDKVLDSFIHRTLRKVICS